MKNLSLSALLLAGACLTQPAVAKISDLLPLPKQVVAVKQTPFNLQRSVRLTDPTSCALLQTVLTEAGATLSDDASATVTVEIVSEIPGAFNHSVNLFPDEAYSLDISSDAVVIRALNATGVIRAAQTLRQLAEGYEEGNAAFECLQLSDWPAFKVRGFMHDVGRSFLSFDELKREIDNLSRFKVNVFHWHLTEKLAWRFEVKAFPQLTAAENMTRYAGQFYTQEQCRELVDYAAERGVTVIPEIDMPGHSAAFKTAMGFDMQSDEGVAALKVVLDEVADVFAGAPYIHIGGDEVTITYPNFLQTMADYVRGKGKKVVMWNRLVAGPPTAALCDMTQMWATSGRVVSGLPNIDCRYNYTNHFDVYADLVGIYKSNIFYEQQGTADVAGTISAAWNDTKTATESDIVRQNNIYANILASAERAWKGGGKAYIESGGTTLPNVGDEFDEFADFERRFLFHKAHSLKNEPIPYVKQTNVRWRITDPFPNNGNNALALPPETCTDEILPSSFELDGKTYGTHNATGAGIWLRHIWHPTVPSFFSSPADNQTAYAWTYVYSPVEQQVGAQIEFYNYSRSGSEMGPIAGQWDRRGSKVWLNDVEIPAPEWQQADQSIPQDHSTLGLTNENFTARPVVQLTLKQGWNKVFMRLPHVNKGGTGRDKWQFTFVFTDTEGKNAVDGLIYSPTQCIDADAERVSLFVDELDTWLRTEFNDKVGYYDPALANDFRQQLEAVRLTLGEEMDAEARNAQISVLTAAREALQTAVASAGINQPKASSETVAHFYIFNTPLRESRYPTSQGADAEVIGNTTASKASMWKFVERTDGTWNIQNAADDTYISPVANYNTALKTVAAEPETGWTISKSNATGFVIITSGNVQFNQTKSAQSYKVYNWGSGTNLTDDGCKYVFTEVEMPQLSTTNDVYWYQFCTPLRGSRYPTGYGDGEALIGETAPTDASVWKFMARSDGSFDIVNKVSGLFVNPDVTNNTALTATAAQPAAGWNFLVAATVGYFGIVSGTSQFNQTNNAGQGWKVFNWGSGTNHSDTGCQYAFTLVGEEHLLDGISSSTTSATDRTFYDLSGRRVVQPQKGHIYLYRGGKFLAR